MNRHLRAPRSQESGMSLVGVLILFPALVMSLELIILGGRVAAARADVQSAAREAARQASLANDFGTASSRADTVSSGALQGKGFQCQTHNTSLAGTDFVAGGVVKVEVRCTVRFSDLDALNIFPGTTVISRVALEPIDKFRAIG